MLNTDLMSACGTREQFLKLAEEEFRKKNKALWAQPQFYWLKEMEFNPDVERVVFRKERGEREGYLRGRTLASFEINDYFAYMKLHFQLLAELRRAGAVWDELCA